jgi:hypothetical protein
MALEAGKASILVAKEADLPNTLNIVREAVGNGELDDALAKAAASKPLTKRTEGTARKR